MAVTEVDSRKLRAQVVRILREKPGQQFASLYSEIFDFTYALEKALIDLEGEGLIDAEGHPWNPRYFLAIEGRP